MDTNVFQQQQNNLMAPPDAQEAEAQQYAEAPDEEVQPPMADAPEPAEPGYHTLDNFSPNYPSTGIPFHQFPGNADVNLENWMNDLQASDSLNSMLRNFASQASF